MRHVISALVMNEPGVLARVAGMFSARGFNIDSLVVGRTENPELSRMTIVVSADDNTLEQVRKQLAKLVEVVKVRDFKGTAYVERDLLLMTVNATPEKRTEIIEACLELLKPYGIEELARSGAIAMARGTQTAKDKAAAAGGSKPRTRSLN